MHVLSLPSDVTWLMFNGSLVDINKADTYLVLHTMYVQRKQLSSIDLDCRSL